MNHRESRRLWRWNAQFIVLALTLALLSLLASAVAASVPDQNSPAATPILNQPTNPTLPSGAWADAEGTSSAADNFVLGTPTTITQIVLWGGYAIGDTPPATDDFTVHFRHDAAGLPGSIIYSEPGIAYFRGKTGEIDVGRQVWKHTLTLTSPLTLDSGTYWVEFYNNTPGTSDKYYCRYGVLDPQNGIDGFGYGFGGFPATGWIVYAGYDLAIQVMSGDPDSPTDADVQMGKAVDDAAPHEGDTVIYTLTVTNNGPADATGIKVGDVLPSGVTYVADDGAGDYDGTTWAVGDLTAEASATLRITVTVDAGTTGTSITNTAVIGALDQVDPVSGNDEARAVLDVTGSPDTDAPIVTLVSPEDGAIGVPLGTNVVINFSEAIHAATFAYTVAPDPGGWTETWTGAKTQVTLSHNEFARWVTYSVTVTGAEDLAGNPMESPYAWSFQTESNWQYLPFVTKNLLYHSNRR